MIRLQSVTKLYKTRAGNRVILDNQTIDFPTNQAIGILGRNGAGKSTFLRMISGVEGVTSGKILRMANLSWPLGFAGGFHGDLTGRENIRFITRIYGADVEYTMAYVEEFSELGTYLDMPVRTYSSGMRAKLAFGTSMAIPFDCYLIDEITSVGDKWFRRKCEIAFNERRERSGIIMVSHSEGTIRNYCDVGMVLHNGELRFFDSINEAMKFYSNTD